MTKWKLVADKCLIHKGGHMWFGSGQLNTLPEVINNADTQIRITIEVEQPAPAKVKRWQWVWRSVEGNYWVTDGHYATAKDASLAIGLGAIVVQPVALSEQEFIDEGTPDADPGRYI